MLGVGKSDGNSQVYCGFVVTPSLQAVWLITWYKYPFHFWNLSNFSFPLMKRGDRKPRSHVWFCGHTLITITEVNRMWGKFGLLELSHGLIIFFPYLKVHPNFEPFVICILVVWFTWDFKWYKAHTCDCIIVFKS